MPFVHWEFMVFSSKGKKTCLRRGTTNQEAKKKNAISVKGFEENALTLEHKQLNGHF